MLTQTRLWQIVRYDPKSGEMVWVAPTGRRVKVGDPVGWMDNHGYRRASIDGKTYVVHRLIWLYMTGAWPKPFIDHRDADRSNNRWKNLREATQQQNMQNGAKRTKGLKGTHWSTRRNAWAAQISIDKKQTFLGYFKSAEAAHAAYAQAARFHFGEFARIA